MKKGAIIVTTINPPTPGMVMLAEAAKKMDMRFIIIGDAKSPKIYNLKGARFLDIAHQKSIESEYARIAPTKSYTRKNIGYLIAMQSRAPVIIETDDDNIPYASFRTPRFLNVRPDAIADNDGWANVYQCFRSILAGGDQPPVIWPRGLPLDQVNADFRIDLNKTLLACPIQQGLANDDPDVDAIWRMLNPDGHQFSLRRFRVALAPRTVCPINSQNTTWFPPAYPLMYLPATCSFRMTDIWRGFVAQRITAANGWHVMFHQPTVYQKRNAHDLTKDFADEVPGYLNNAVIRTELFKLHLPAGIDRIHGNMRRCYDRLVDVGMLGREELTLLNAWLDDVDRVRQ